MSENKSLWGAHSRPICRSRRRSSHYPHALNVISSSRRRYQSVDLSASEMCNLGSFLPISCAAAVESLLSAHFMCTEGDVATKDQQAVLLGVSPVGCLLH